MTSDELNAIKARNAARTPGKWAESFRGSGIDAHQAGGEPSLLHWQREKDAVFIAACSEDVPALIAEVELLQAELAEAQQEIERLKAVVAALAPADY